MKKNRIEGVVVSYSKLREINNQYACDCDCEYDYAYDYDYEYAEYRRMHYNHRYPDHFFSYESILIEYSVNGEPKRLFIPYMYNRDYIRPGDTIILKYHGFSKRIEPWNCL